MSKLNVLCLILCLILIPLKKSLGQKSSVIYLQFDRTSPSMDVIQYGNSKDQHRFFRIKMIRKGDSYKKAILKYTGKKWDGEHIARDDTYLLFKENREIMSKTLSLSKIRSYNLKDITWIRKNYFNHYLNVKRDTAKYMYDLNRKYEKIYIAEIDSAKREVKVTRVNYNLPITK